MKVKEIILKIFSETGKLLLMSESELRQYLCNRFDDDRFLTYAKIELDAALTGVLEGRSCAIEYLIDMLPGNCVYADTDSVKRIGK